ncbi:acyltransferase family protein [Nonomuraea endophytica]|uniref:Peptidoglycan/LPS O-acetylase OafA/YrhL n=1 Tax=Nonomuraea endophytica TaxID=714136 RepID=A0A7W8EDM9_9ACTN|nr:acyltransferase [Nonomuraea endophytica]MBB5075446.1 peptidoglycan/LPS O-acetylase OafA/YrhL [Nonomuraea endophytica]
MSELVVTRKRLDSLTGLRWIAAFAVFGFHIHAAGLTSDPALKAVLSALFSAGAAGVPFFFILSGMVLTWSARPGTSPGVFWRRRAARVLPNHVLTWLAVLALLAVSGAAVSAGPALSGLVLLQSWVPVEAYYFGGNTPAWSLSCELAFYAVFPVLLPLLRRVPARLLGWVAGGILAGIWAVPLLSQPMGDDIAYWFVWIFPVTRALEFALGIALALLVASGRWRGPGLPVAAVIALAAYATVPFVWERWGWVAWTAGPFALLIAAAATSDNLGERVSFLASRPMVWLGEISFAFYLVHQPVIRVAGRLVGGDRPVPLVLLAVAGMLALALAASWALYRYVERPLERRLR